jgi:hypothetical protein
MALNEIRSAFLPYCIRQIKNGLFVILNRERLPLGVTDINASRDNEQHAVRLTGLDANTAKRLSARGSSDLDEIYLYNDGCIPTSDKKSSEAYFARLLILSNLRITPS